jgi:glycosyltransferase involved in cell wall biosynthesis
MRVALDATYSLGTQPSGVAVYSSKIIQALARAAPDEHFILCYRANRFFRALLSQRPAANCSRRLLEEPLCFFIQGQAAIFHGLNQRLPRCRLPRTVTTFHDLFVLSGDYSTPEYRRRFTVLARDAAARSDHIIAVSQFTADQVAERLGYAETRITVIHHGGDPVPEFPADELRAFRQRHSLEAPFLLCVGALQVRKNISRLLQAFERMGADCLLLLTGSSGYGAEEIQQRIQASPVRSRVRVFGYVSSDVLNRLYRTASALAFPSLEEGFGFPVVEAMSAGVPVVTSNGSALAEIARGAALLVNPLDAEEIQLALERVVSDTECRRHLIEAGHERASTFSWEKAAATTLDLYRRL